ncbi:MAG: ABC transporter permease [bacterium]
MVVVSPWYEILGLGRARGILRRLGRDPTAMFGLALVVALVFVGVCAPLLAPQLPMEQSLRDSLGAPMAKGHLLGTDQLGRDLLSRIIYGTRISLTLGVLVCTGATFIGVILGSFAGYFGRWADIVIMRAADIILAFPFLILAIAILAIFEEPSLKLVFVVVGVVSWAPIARLVRAQILVAKELDYVNAAVALGAGTPRVLFLHVLPNCIAPVIIWFTMGIAGAIMAEASLSFLGMGAEPGVPSWGSMINEGFSYMRREWWLTVFPGVALALTVLGFNLLGDGLQDAMNPRLKK